VNDEKRQKVMASEEEFEPTNHPHRRYNPMKAEWVLVCPHRCQRPWSGQTEDVEDEERPEFDPTNGLCPGVARSSGAVNPQYTSTYVFTNDFPALLTTVPDPKQEESEDDLFKVQGAQGTCKVMCFSPKSNVTVPQMSVDELVVVVKEWIDQFKELAAVYQWVQIFENKGAMMGCSNPHPHCQIWASSFLPNEAATKDANFKAYYQRRHSAMLVDYAQRELAKKERIVCQNADWLVVVPYWAIWPYETMVLPIREHLPRMSDLTPKLVASLADIMKRLTTRYDNLFKTSFPYSMGFHGAPTGPGSGGDDSGHWQFHAIYYPPLLRSATVKKHMVGYEMLANVQRDLTAEQAAQKLRDASEIHYKSAK